MQLGSVEIYCGYFPGVIGRITEMHALYYSGLVGFGQYFESKVATEIAEFMSRMDNCDNGLWTALQAGRIVGSVVIDVNCQTRNVAHLRWFIVDAAFQGKGIGRRLLEEAIKHSDHRELESIYLWTFSGLDAARHLYESVGFGLATEKRAAQWGKEVMEQKFVRNDLNCKKSNYNKGSRGQAFSF